MDYDGMFLILLLLIEVVKGNVVFEVHHKYAGRDTGGAPIGVLKAHDSKRHGRALAGIDFQLGGDGSPTNTAYVLILCKWCFDFFCLRVL